MKERIVIAMSGGVDSSTAAALLKDAGYDVIGISMQIWDYSAENSERFGTCCSLDDINDARRVAEKIGIPFYVLKLEDEFKKNVVDYFISEYLRGRTPNPCIPCNQRLKFDILLNYAAKIGASKVATGHYARIHSHAERGNENGNRYFIQRGVDINKDQSYFLFNLTQEQLKKALFPLGDYTKSEIRKMAKSFGLKVAEKEESQEICFIPDNNYADFIAGRVDAEKIIEGEIVTTDGAVVGRHKGLPFYTIGQRKGLGISWSRPLYVSEIDVENNRLIVNEGEALMRREFIVENVNWSIDAPTDGTFRASTQIRYRHPASESEITSIPTQSMGTRNNSVRVIFDEPQRAITPGQAAVFYDGDTLIGGGWIRETLNTNPKSQISNSK
ncbi:MAG: tRNA 2-thiouridine(34) synthase MnmA [Nitrospinae bacterium]|nr:tRNA 2-thiouridine(34) synthase MnmA [Nitrospinota bacterium]MBI3814056.1 tRNA 2-thiouridine(34) synthase MnmA [Nitrospinota bacterium]